MVASLTVRDLDHEVKAKLKVQAAEHGRSMEAEAREILAAAVVATRPPSGLGTWIHQHVAPVGGVELAVPARDDTARSADFE